MTSQAAGKKIARFHYITQPVKGQSYAQSVYQACDGGVRWVQLRLKEASDRQWEQIVPRVQEVCKSYGAQLVINDRVNMAQRFGADGVHLGQKDLPPREAREKLKPGTIIGGTAHSWNEFIRMAEQGVDYMGVGPFRYTETKKKLAPILGIKGITEIARQNRNSYQIPIVAIGGILPADLKLLLQTGIYGVAVSSGINQADDITTAAQQYQIELKTILHGTTS